MDRRREFAERLRSRQALAGIFVKSRDPATVEILALADFDFVVIDAEHVAFSRADIALMIMAARAGGIAALVRVPSADPVWIGTCVDAGAAGVMVPQVRDAQDASSIVRRMRFGPGGAGFSPSTAAALYGTRTIAGHLSEQPRETVLICQIETPDAVENAMSIAAVEGVDGLLVGPVDLAVCAGLVDPNADEIEKMTIRVMDAARVCGIGGGVFLGDAAKVPVWQAHAATVFVMSSDQALLAAAARNAVPEFHLAGVEQP